jgi:hypothetical protein
MGMFRRADVSPATGYYYVVHPLDDEPEEKLNTEGMGHMHMTRSVKLSLLALRLYLIMMVMLVLYRVVEMASMGIASMAGIH